MTLTALTGTYAQVAADVTALTLIQCPHKGSPLKARAIELVVAADTPAATVRGLELASGETMVADRIADLGASGKLYARAVWGATTGEILTL